MRGQKAKCSKEAKEKKMEDNKESALEELRMRGMVPSDAEALFLLARSVDPFSWSVGNFLDSLKAGDRITLLTRVTALKEEILGFFVLRTVLDASELMDIAVAAPFQGRGLGRRLLNAALKTAKLSGAARVTLEVRESNFKARSLYETAGFTVDAVRKGYYRAREGRENAVLMTKVL